MFLPTLCYATKVYLFSDQIDFIYIAQSHNHIASVGLRTVLASELIYIQSMQKKTTYTVFTEH